MTSRFLGRFLAPLPLVTRRHKRSDPSNMTSQIFLPLENKQTSNFKRNMFRINFIVVHVEGENNYMSKNSKCPGYFIRILLQSGLLIAVAPRYRYCSGATFTVA